MNNWRTYISTHIAQWNMRLTLVRVETESVQPWMNRSTELARGIGERIAASYTWMGFRDSCTHLSRICVTPPLAPGRPLCQDFGEIE
jgi:hypothetical protein